MEIQHKTMKGYGKTFIFVFLVVVFLVPVSAKADHCVDGGGCDPQTQLLCTVGEHKDECLGAINCEAECTCGQTCPSGTICIINPLDSCTVGDVIDAIANFLFYLAIAIVPLLIVYAAFRLLTSAGDPTKVKNAKDTILYAVIGFIVVLSAKILIGVVKTILGI